MLHQSDHTTTFQESAQSTSDDFGLSNDLPCVDANFEHRAIRPQNFGLVALSNFLLQGGWEKKDGGKRSRFCGLTLSLLER